MARKTISQRIQLLGSEAVRRELAELGEAGEAAFRDIQAAAEKLKGPGAGFARGMDRAIKRARELGEQIRKTGERIRNFGAGLSVGVTAPLGLIGRSFIQAASDAQEAASAFDFVFRESAGAVRDWSSTVARELGRGTQAIRDQALSFQQLCAQVAPTHDAAVELSKQFTVLAQDLASFFNVSESDALAKLRSGLAGESEPLRDFGVFINEAAVEAKALELGLMGTNDALTDQEKVLARAAIILEKTTAAEGDAARTSGSYANQLRRLQGLCQDLPVELGQIVLPVALRVVQALAGIVQTLQALPAPVQAAIVVIAAIAAALGPILLVVGQMAIGLGALRTGFAAIVGAAAPLGAALAGVTALFGALAGALQFVLGLAASLLAWPVALGAAIGVLAVVVARNWDDIVETIAGALASVEEAVKSAMDGVRRWFGDAFDWVKGRIKGVLDWAIAKVNAVKSAMSGIFSGGSGSAPGAPGFAGGGRVRGPGTTTSDSILARLSRGEFVVRARAVQHYGAEVFERLNAMAMPRTLVPAFAGGGLVVPVPAAGGGSGSGGATTLNLTIGAEVFEGLTAPRETAERLIRFATTEETRRAGRRPAWYGGS